MRSPGVAVQQQSIAQQQRTIAEQQRTAAQEQRNIAEKNEAEAKQERDQALLTQSRLLSESGDGADSRTDGSSTMSPRWAHHWKYDRSDAAVRAMEALA